MANFELPAELAKPIKKPSAEISRTRAEPSHVTQGTQVRPLTDERKSNADLALRAAGVALVFAAMILLVFILATRGPAEAPPPSDAPHVGEPSEESTNHDRQ